MQFLKRLSIKGILVGAIVDIGSSITFLILFFIFAVIFDTFAHVPLEQITHTPLAHAILMAGGGACSVLGGYISARLAKHDEMLNGILASFLCVLLSLVHMVTGKNLEPIYLHFVYLAAGPASGLLGGYLRLRQKQNISNR